MIDPETFVGIDFGRPGGDMTVAVKTWFDPVTQTMVVKEIAASEFYAEPEGSYQPPDGFEPPHAGPTIDGEFRVVDAPLLTRPHEREQ